MMKKIICCVSLFSLLLTGCGDLVEIQQRDFVLALGVSYQSGKYRITYGLPDLAKVTEQSKESESDDLIRTYEGSSLPEISQNYNFNSENRLDYRHLQVIVLDKSICSDQSAMKKLLIDLNDNYDISNNVLVYYYDFDVEEVMKADDSGGSIGEHLKKLSKNNETNKMEPAKIGTLIDCLANKRTLFIPELKIKDDSVLIDGGIFFLENHKVKQIGQLESMFYFICLGQGQGSLIRLSPEHLIELKDVKVKTKYTLTEDGPVIYLMISGAAKSLPRLAAWGSYPKEMMSQRIQKEIEHFLDENMKEEGFDYLNFYEKSSYKSRQMWLDYQDRQADFVDDIRVDVSVDIEYE